MSDVVPKLRGAWPTMVTPFGESSEIDLGAYCTMIDWYVDRGVGGLYANCLSSEMYWIDDDERVLLASEAVRTARGRVPVAATGNLGETMEEHISLCRRIAETGVDVVMLVVPPFLQEEREIQSYFLTMADAIDAPLGIYECPVPRRYHLPEGIVTVLAQSGRFVAYKETSENIDKIRALLQLTQDTPLSMLQACNAYLLDSIQAGGLGTMSVAAIHLPDLVSAIIERGLSQAPDAEQLQGALCAMMLAQRAAHPHGTKYLLGKRGVPITSRCRKPNTELRAETVRALDYAANWWFTDDGGLRILENYSLIR